MEFKDILFGLTVILWAFAYCWGVLPVDDENRLLKQNIMEMLELKEQQAATIVRKQLELQQLQNKDPRAIEKVLREKYNYCREHETVGLYRQARGK